ncbi:MAG: hypothetical protein M0Z48_06330 [Nitrospiraceae bacterium]|nr:hypothetical protein [Nitrospiraceae bacterium]
MFDIFLTDEAREQLNQIKNDKGLSKRYKAVKKTIQFLSQNPRHPGLQTHEFTTLKGPKGEKVFEAYAEQATPAAYRIFWFYGPKGNQITIVSITPHP